MKIKIYKFLLKSIGKILPLKRHPGGLIANSIRCFFAKNIVEHIGFGCVIEPGAELHEGCVLGDITGIGPNCMIGPNCTFLGHSMMGPNVHIYTENHIYNEELHCFKGSQTKPVTVGEYSWIGYNSIICPGVTIGNHTIIGAGSVVTKDIPGGVMAAGNPCIVKKVIDKAYYNEYVNQTSLLPPQYDI